MTQVATGKHYLIISTLSEDDGFFPYDEEREWRIVHPPDCKHGEIQDNMHICPVEDQVHHSGLDLAETPDGEMWDNLEDGSYEIEAWHEGPDKYTGEYDGGLTIYPDRPGILMSDHDR